MKFFALSGTEILLNDTSRVWYVAFIITTHRIKLRAVSVYLTPLLSCIRGICVSMNYEIQMSGRSCKITLYVRQPQGLPSTPRRSVIRFPVHAQHYFFHFLLLICPDALARTPLKACPIFPITDFSPSLRHLMPTTHVRSRCSELESLPQP